MNEELRYNQRQIFNLIITLLLALAAVLFIVGVYQ